MRSKSRSKSESNNSSPLKMNSSSNEMKEKRILIDRLLDKLNENKLYTVAIAIFLELKANNYEATDTKIINQKILSDFKTNKKHFLKNERDSEYYDSETPVQRAIVASLTVTNVLRRIKKGNQTFVKFNFIEAEEYLKKIKNRQINSLIRDELELFYKNNSNNSNKVNENNIKENKEKDNNSSMDMNDDNFQDDFSISLDSNYVGGEEKKPGENNLNNSFEDPDQILSSNKENKENNTNANNNTMNNNSNNSINNNNNSGINLNGGLKKRTYIKRKRGLIDNNNNNNIKKLKINRNNNESESDSEGVKMLENYDIINDTNTPGVQKKFIKRRRRRRRNQSNQINKNGLEIDIHKFRGRPKKKIFGNFPSHPFISINNKENQNDMNNKVIEIVEENPEEVRNKQINNYLDHLYSFNKLENSKTSDDDNSNNNKEPMKNISDKSLNIVSKFKVLYELINKIEDNLDSLSNIFSTQTSLTSTNESESSPKKKDAEKENKLYKNMKKNEGLLDMCYNNIKLSLQTLDNISKFKNLKKNDDLLDRNKNMLKEYEKEYERTLEKFSKNLNDINELAFNHNALKIYDNFKNIKNKLKKEKITIGPFDNFLKKLENNLENESNKYFNIENIKQVYIDKKQKLMKDYTHE